MFVFQFRSQITHIITVINRQLQCYYVTDSFINIIIMHIATIMLIQRRCEYGFTFIIPFMLKEWPKIYTGIYIWDTIFWGLLLVLYYLIPVGFNHQGVLSSLTTGSDSNMLTNWTSIFGYSVSPFQSCIW